jgi:2-amino-4-hydroxy-6-hydroxymethyldihydropteridine diphosphokinase
MGKVAFLGLGSNLGDREAFLNEAIALIGLKAGKVVSSSSIYETEPWGFQSKDKFLNMVVEIETDLDPDSLLLKLLEIESGMGRERKNTGYSSRNIDIDILIYDNLCINKPDLHIPHPMLHRRRFVLVPLCDIAPGVIHPVLKKSIADLLTDCTDTSMIVRVG